MTKLYEIGENEIRIIGSQSEQTPAGQGKRRWVVVAVAAALLLLGWHCGRLSAAR